jgi:hypothetical protein
MHVHVNLIREGASGRIGPSGNAVWGADASGGDRADGCTDAAVVAGVTSRPRRRVGAVGSDLRRLQRWHSARRRSLAHSWARRLVL